LNLNIWYLLGIIFLISLAITLYVFIDPANPLKDHIIIHFIAFSIIQIFGWRSGRFKEDKANGFMKSIKAIDIYAHMYGGFAFFLIFVGVFNLDPFINIFITFIIVGISFELLELLMERFVMLLERKGKVAKSKRYGEYISEPWGNILQDLIFDIVGIIIGFYYISFLAGVNIDLIFIGVVIILISFVFIFKKKNMHIMWVFLLLIFGLTISIILNNLYITLLSFILGLILMGKFKKSPSENIRFEKSRKGSFLVWVIVFGIVICLIILFWRA